MGPLHHPKRRLSVAHDMIGSRRRIVYCKQARQPDSRQSGNKFYKAYKRNKLLRAFSLLKDTQPELRISSKITVQRVFNLPGFPHNQTRTVIISKEILHVISRRPCIQSFKQHVLNRLRLAGFATRALRTRCIRQLELRGSWQPRRNFVLSLRPS